MRLRFWVTTSLLVPMFSVTAFAQGYVVMLPDEIKNPFFERHKTITDQLAKGPANEWAGVYYREIGMTWSEGLFWDPRTGFAAFRDTCSNGPRAWVNYGQASFSDGMLLFSPERKKGDEFLLELPSTKFTPIRWGTQHWLVPSERLALFAYAVNSRSGDPYTVAYLKFEDSEKQQGRHPDLPTEYRRLLSLPPIKARIVEIAAKDGNWYPAMTIDAGKGKGVIEGMSFWLVGQKHVTFTIEVTEVRERTSVVFVTEAGHTAAFDNDIIPAIGWRFTSRYPY
jgi:hypothetical protein